ncbi:MAG: EthD family reductase [Ardenticatenaceae bacterium]|nr:EthD family reductase [Ardenticatenaceae bacterium]
MYKLTALYRQVDKPDTLEEFFSTTHLPLAEQLPGLRKSEVSRINHKPGGQSRFTLMYELYFESEKALQAAFTTTPGLQLIRALQPWADARILTWFYADVYEEGLPDWDEEE